MPSEVTLLPPARFAAHWDAVSEGWKAFFDNKDSKDNPYPAGLRHDAWKWGFFEGMDYGQ